MELEKSDYSITINGKPLKKFVDDTESKEIFSSRLDHINHINKIIIKNRRKKSINTKPVFHSKKTRILDQKEINTVMGEHLMKLDNNLSLRELVTLSLLTGKEENTKSIINNILKNSNKLKNKTDIQNNSNISSVLSRITRSYFGKLLIQNKVSSRKTYTLIKEALNLTHKEAFLLSLNKITKKELNNIIINHPYLEKYLLDKSEDIENKDIENKDIEETKINNIVEETNNLLEKFKNKLLNINFNNKVDININITIEK